jgi:hypothetical protein
MAIACLSALTCLTHTLPLVAQPKPGYLPSSTHVFPAGGQRGTTVALKVGAECIPPRTRIHVIGDGVEVNPLLEREIDDRGEPSALREPKTVPITYPREWASEIRIADDAPLGPAYWRLSCAQGGTGSRPFIVGDLPEFIESESNSTLDRAEQVELPVTVNGQIHGERDSDHFRFSIKGPEIVSFEVIAGRMGSSLDPVVDLLDIDGRPIDAQRVYVGSDPVLVYAAHTDQDVVLRIANVSHRGDPSFVYRIDVRPGPYFRAALPGGLRRDEGASIDLLGMTGSEGFLTEKLSIVWGGNEQEFLIWHNPIQHEAPVRYSIDRHPVIVETEPNATMPDSQSLPVPSTMYGCFIEAADKDTYAFDCNKGDRLRIECRAWPPGTPAIPTMQLTGADGKTLASASSASTEDMIARLAWTAPDDGLYGLQLTDLRFGAQGDEDFVYRLEIQPDEPDFELSVATDTLTATQGKTANLEVKVRRHGGLNDPIELKFQGLPEGIKVDKAVISKGKSTAKVQFTIDESARVESYQLQVSGLIAETGLTRTARCQHLGVDSEGVSIGSTTVPWLFLSIQHKPLFRLQCAEAYLYAHRGSVFEYPMEIERLNGFDGVVRLQRGDRQNRDMDGVQILDATLNPGESEVDIPIYLPESMAINVQSQTQLYSQAWASFIDEHDQPQSVLVLAEKRNMLRTLPPVVKLKAERTELTVPANGRVDCPIILDRTSNFPGVMRVTLQNPPPGVSADAAEFEVGESIETITLRLDKATTASSAQEVTLRGTGRLPDGTVAVSEAIVWLISVN